MIDVHGSLGSHTRRTKRIGAGLRSTSYSFHRPPARIGRTRKFGGRPKRFKGFESLGLGKAVATHAQAISKGPARSADLTDTKYHGCQQRTTTCWLPILCNHRVFPSFARWDHALWPDDLTPRIDSRDEN